MSNLESVRAWILAWLERELDVPAAGIATDETLLNYGMDSVNAIMLVGDLENMLKLRLPPTLLWDHSTVDALALAVTSGTYPAAGGAVTEEPHELSAAEAERLLANIDQLSEAEVSALLARLSGS